MSRTAATATTAGTSPRLRALRAELDGTGIELDASERRRQEYSFDASNYRVRPLAVAFPRTAEEARRIVLAATASGIPLTARGGGTSIAGNSVGAGLVIDLSRHLTRVESIEDDGTVWAEAGTVLTSLRAAVEARSGGRLTFAPDPSSSNRVTLGGAIGNDACGNHSVAYGRTSHHVLALEVLTADGAHLIVERGAVRPARPDDRTAADRAREIEARLRALAAGHLALLRRELDTIPRQVSGYQLSQLLPEHGFDVARALVGSEGSCVLILRARVRLVPKPAAVALVCIGYDSTVDSARDVPAMLEQRPSAVEGLDATIADIMRARRGPESVSALPAGSSYVMVEFADDTAAAAAGRCEALIDRLRQEGRIRDHVLVTSASDRATLWRVREDGAGLSSLRPDGVQTWPGWEDSAVAPDRLGDYLAELLPLIARHGLSAALYGHFGAGCVHLRLDFELRSPAGRLVFDAFMRDAARLVVAHGGSLSGEHGDGRARGELLGLMYSQAMLELFREFKLAWDPEGLLNPGIVVDPPPMTEALALHGAALPLAVVGNAHACIGVGRCRADVGGMMCPSYRATRDEKDSTRGRARVLQELARGRGTSAGGWNVPEVREALDLCLSCKACSSDCPTGVDIAEAKSVLLDEHYRRSLRPLTHYTIGWLPRWLPLLTRVSRVANAAAGVRALRRIGERFGISAHRTVPPFAARRAITARLREAEFARDGEVLVFADSFTRAFRPDVIPAAARVLRASGSTVGCAPEACCGLTWISTGQRRAAATRLSRLVRRLDDGTERDIVVLEPSCAATIRDEAPKLVPGPASRRVAARIRSFAVAVDAAMEAGWRPEVPPPDRAVVQTHCHEHAVFGSGASRRVLRAWGVGQVAESSSCCGVAGNFGFESEHFELSMRVGEHSLAPALAAGGASALVLTDGFSCSVQVAQLDPGRAGTHLATALDPGAPTPSRPSPGLNDPA